MVYLNNHDQQQHQHIQFVPSSQHHRRHSRYRHFLILEHQLVLNVRLNLQSCSNQIYLHKVGMQFVRAKPPKQHLNQPRSWQPLDRCDDHDQYQLASLQSLAFHTYLQLSPMLQQLLKITFAYKEVLRRRHAL